MNAAINGFLHDGGDWVAYMGHGSLNAWSASNFWSRLDAEASSNTIYPIFTIFTCQNGGFQDPVIKTLVESLLFEPAAASAVFAPTAASIQARAALLAEGFYGSFTNPATLRLGDAAEAAFLHLWGQQPYARELLFYTIFGDPALLLDGGASP
jgi:hypothetical protein